MNARNQHTGEYYAHVLAIRHKFATTACAGIWLVAASCCFADLLETNQPPSASEQPYRLNEVTVIGYSVETPLGGGSVTELPGKMLADRLVESPRQLTAVVPNLTVFDANGDRIPRFSSRGLRENNFGYTETAVTIYVDDVPYFDSFSRGVPLYNVESAEFLHGPQGTSFGASRPGGVLNLFTHLPGNEWEGGVSAFGGSYNTANVSAYGSGPLIKDHVFGGLDGLYARRDGYFHNTVTDSNPDSRDTLAGRASVRWKPIERLDLTFTAGGDRFNDGDLIARPLNQQGNFYDIHQDYEGHNDQSSQTYSCRAAWTGDQVRIINVASYRDWRQDLTGDYDFTPAAAAVGFDHPHLTQWTEELRLESRREDTKVKWSAGGFAAGRDLDRGNGLTYGPDAAAFYGAPIPAGASDQTLSSADDVDLAIFGQVVYSPSEKVDLTGGIRGEYDERQMNVNHLYPFAPPLTWDQSHDFASVQPKGALAYHFAPTVDGWFTYSRGYQPGGFNQSANSASTAAFAASTSDHYELGVSGHCLDGSFAATLSAFWIETQDYQVYRPVSPTSFQVLNADNARSYGVEAEVHGRCFKDFEVRIVGAWTHAQFRNFTAPNPLTGQPESFDGNDINFVPEFTLDASVTYRHKKGYYATLGTTVVGEYWFDESNTTKQDPYGLLYARAGWSNNHFDIAFVGSNMLDKHYYANALDFGPGFGFQYGTSFVVTPGDPAVFGVQVSAKF